VVRCRSIKNNVGKIGALRASGEQEAREADRKSR
jgi:hypothetical protein